MPPKVPGTDANALKQAIIDLARSQIGSHYLWGGAGNRPGKADGAFYRTDHVKLHPNVPDLDTGNDGHRGAPYSPMIFAAWVDSSDHGLLVCCGRCALPEVQQVPLALPLDHPTRYKLKDMKADDVAVLKKQSDTPLKFRWPRPGDTLDSSATAWGESCVDIRHFDCIGLVNWCFSTVLQNHFQKSVDHFSVSAKGQGFTEVPIRSARACDIVTFDRDHIGIATGEGSAVEAMSTAEGVQETQMSKRPWTMCVRIPDSQFRIGAD